MVLVMLAPMPGFAQRETRGHTCRILFFDAPAGAPQKLFLFDGSSSQEVDLPKMNFSQLYQLASGKIAVTLLPEAIDDPEKIPVGAPKVSVPEGVVDFYLLVTSDKENKVAPVRMQVVNAGMDRLRPGQMLWFNLTPNIIEGKVGIQRLQAMPNSRVVLDPPARAAGEFPIKLSFRIPGDGRSHPLFSTSWGHDPRSRNIVFADVQPGSRTPRVRAFNDFREPPANLER